MKDGEIGKEIKIVYQNKEKVLEITKKRKYFINKRLGYALIEILPEDGIKNFFRIIDKKFFDNYKELDFFLLQYYEGKEIGFSNGEVVGIEDVDNIILHNCPRVNGSGGAPLILRVNQSQVIGMHFGILNNRRNNRAINYASSIISIINDIKNKSTIFKDIDYKEKYKNLEKIGKGNFGEVYKSNIGKENCRALKIIDKNEMKERLRINFNKYDIEEEFKLYIEDKLNTEIEIMRICMKDNINSVQFYECYDTENEYAIVMELCDDNLHNLLIKKPTGFNCNEVLDIIKQLNNTFKIMSEKLIVHRDLKLENILIKYIDKKKSKFIVKLTDYGVSRKILSLSKKCSTHTGTILTMAPEILAGEEYDSKCDLWSLGVIIYQLFFKKYPYDALTEVAIYNKIKNLGQSILEKTGNEKFDNLIKKLLVENPLNRLSWEDYFNDPLFQNN